MKPNTKPLGYLTRRKSWNQKNLDYEIETSLSNTRYRLAPQILEIKRTSITRLKLLTEVFSLKPILILKSKEPRLRDWNCSSGVRYRCQAYAWNQKNLDYEIETGTTTRIMLFPLPPLKSKEPRLRDWNHSNRQDTHNQGQTELEIKRTSITRLKQFVRTIAIRPASPWNQKNLDYEIETASR